MLMPTTTRVFLATGSTDMRKSINGLSILIENQFEIDPFSGHLFAFCNRRRNIVKILYWQRTGFCVWMKRLEKDRLIWPESPDAIHEIDQRQLCWLLEGLSLNQTRGHAALHYRTLM
ncbi:MAG: IS66 family insertion sequence element accessory protein TnpB [Patescibacteria group bacterium]